MNFAWSLRPIFIWLNVCLGLDFDRSKKKKNIRRWFLIFFSLLLLCLTILSNTYYMATHILEIKSYLNSTSAVQEPIVSFWNRTFTWLLIYILSIAFHLSAVVSAFVKWKSLWKKIKLVQVDLSDLSTSYRRLRCETLVALLLLSVVIPIHYFNNISVLNLIW